MTTKTVTLLGDTEGSELVSTWRTTTATAWPTPTTLAGLSPSAVEAEPRWISAAGRQRDLRHPATASERSTILVATRPQ
jgi:hypothetical protein